MAINHAWSWYEMSLGHRLQVANYLLVLLLANATAYVAALQAHLDTIAGSVAVFAIISTLTSAYIVRRCRQRMAAAAVPLAKIQCRLADTLDLPELKMIEAIESAEYRWTSTRRLASYMYFLVIVTFAIASGFAFSR